MNTLYEDAPIIGTSPGDGGKFSSQDRLAGRDWPSVAHTMIGLNRLNNIQDLVEDLLKRGVQGDLIETGVWRGGATIFMRALLKAYEVADRIVWVADSFEGLPSRGRVSPKSYTSREFARSSEASVTDHGLLPSFSRVMSELRRGTSLEEVRTNFRRYDMLDEQVRFLPGWFEETLRGVTIQRLALLRIDCDIYDSTFQCLEYLYPRVSEGGYVIVDDYNLFSECRNAVHDYLNAATEAVEIVAVDESAVFWKKEHASPAAPAQKSQIPRTAPRA